MSIEKGDFESINEIDLLELVDARVPEGLRLDYKLETYGRSDADKKELLKDVSALANSSGGHIVMGVNESEGSAIEIPGLNTDCDAEILRLEQILRSAIEPTISGIKIRQIPVSNERKVILLRVPRSWNSPHRITFQGVNKFYMRHSAGIHEPSIEELRAMFNQSESALEKANEFHRNRIDRILVGEGQRPLVGSGRLILHIVPVASFSGLVNLDVEAIHQINQSFIPLAADGMNTGFNFYGYRTEHREDKNYGYTQIFRNSILEATKGEIVNETNNLSQIPGLASERYFFQRYESYINGLRDLGVPAPLVILITLEGVKGARYEVSRDIWREIPPLLPDEILVLPECVIENYGTTKDYHRAIRPAFDSLWNAIGYSKAQFFNDDGIWVGDLNGR